MRWPRRGDRAYRNEAAKLRLGPGNLLGIAGWSGSGKTTLIEALIPLLRARGRRVSTIKRTHHDVDLDRPGKDSYRHRDAGAEEVMVVSGTRFALLREMPDGADLADLVSRMAPVDVVLAEGFKMADLPKLEVHRPSLGKPRLWPETRGIVALATDGPATAGLPCFNLNDPAAIAAWIAPDAAGP